MSYLLDVKNLTCQRGYHQLFSNLNFTLNQGNILRISGENGTGKTSLLRMIAGLNLIEQGEILLLNDCQKHQNYQKNVIYLGHCNAINPQLSVLDNLMFLVNLKQYCTTKIAQKALDEIGLQYYYHEPCSQLSAGQKRRVLLASLLILDTPLWLLDEPFTALDTKGVALIEDLILAHTKKRGACIFTTHQNTKLNQCQTLTL